MKKEDAGAAPVDGQIRQPGNHEVGILPWLELDLVLRTFEGDPVSPGLPGSVESRLQQGAGILV